ncbi:MAG: nitrophenyl compound nitroreductase subunit ArsF family protein [Ignavibacteriae bacterium]|nr:nitrophenyl compound nitroreductase subunit ArsF family protein [Ignavibacteriota bacterium]
MKYSIIFFALIIMFFSCTTGTKKVQENKNENGVSYTMYYFHPTARCESCINIENCTKELLVTKYKSNPEIKFVPLNIENSENEHFTKDYNLKFSSVILTKQKNSKEEKYKNLDSIWTYSGNKDGFIKYADSEIESFIK